MEVYYLNINNVLYSVRTPEYTFLKLLLTLYLCKKVFREVSEPSFFGNSLSKLFLFLVNSRGVDKDLAQGLSKVYFFKLKNVINND